MILSDVQFSGLFHGKSVVLIGPAPWLSGSGKGPFIDSFDICVRINRGFLVNRDYPADLGSRTDVLYTCAHEHSQLGVNSGPVDLDYFRDIGLKTLCFHEDPKRKIKDKIKQDNHVPCHIIDGNLIEDLRNNQLSGEKPHTGTIAIEDLLRTSLSKFFLIGFTFFQGAHVYMPEYKNWNDNLAMKECLRLHENPVLELDYFVRKKSEDDRIDNDYFLQDIIRRRAHAESKNI